MIVIIKTANGKKVEEGLELFKKGLIANESSHGKIFSDWKKIKEGEYECEIKYHGENRVSNWIVKKELKKLLRKLDKGSEVR